VPKKLSLYFGDNIEIPPLKDMENHPELIFWAEILVVTKNKKVKIGIIRINLYFFIFWVN
jgi:hypothetical protein